MASSLCLEYQARARGKSTNTRSWTDRQAIVNAWEIKYKPCLDCQQGKEIAANGGEDDDVEELKQNHGTKLCPKCKAHLPKSAFGPHSGNKDGLQTYCRQCQRNIQNECSAKKRAAKFIDQNSPNIASKVDTDAIKTSNIPAPSGLTEEDRQELTMILQKIRTCERCGWTGPERQFHKAGFNGYIDICRACIQKKRIENDTFRKQNTVILTPHSVVINFADFPDILETLTAEAQRNFRTLANEILFRVVNHGGRSNHD